MVEDVSRRTVTVLLILTLVVSTLSLFAIKDALATDPNIKRVEISESSNNNLASAQVHLTIENQAYLDTIQEEDVS